MKKLNIETKIDNGTKQQLLESGLVSSKETIGANEFNTLVYKTNELVEAYNFGMPITAFNFKENVATYVDLPIEGNEINDGYGVIKDGLIYVWNGNAFPTEGMGIDLGLKPFGKVHENDMRAVSGSEVYKKIQNFTDNGEFDYAVVDSENKLLFGITKEGSLYPEQKLNLESVYATIENKVDKAEGKELIDSAVAKTFKNIEHPEFAYLIVDKKDRIIQGVTHDGIYFPQNTIVEKTDVKLIGKTVNNLKNQESILSLDQFKDYGRSTAEYHIKTDFKGRISVKGRFVNDINKTEKKQSLVSTTSGTSILDIIHAKPIQAIEKLYLSSTYEVMLPQAALQSGFKSGDTVRRYENYNNRSSGFTMMDGIQGDQMIVFWFKGKSIIEKISNITEVSNTNSMLNYFTEQEQRERSNYLQEFYHDLYVSIENDVFTVGRDRSGIMFSTSLKDSLGKWKNLKSFYEELVPSTFGNQQHSRNSIQELSDFYIDHINLNTLETTSTILQCGKIYLISYLQQCINPDNLGEGNTTEMAYDCYPFFIHSNVNKSVHVFDFILYDQTIDVFVNGLKYSTFPKEKTIIIGSSQADIQVYDLEINYGDYGDAEIFTHYNNFTSLASERTPSCFGIMAHNIYNTYEGSTHPLENLGISTTKLYRILEDAKKQRLHVY